MNNYALALIKKCLETKSTFLDLGKCALVDEDFTETSVINIALSECTQLKKLILSNYWFIWFYDGTKVIAQSQNESHDNKLTVSPSSLSLLVHLEELIWGDIKTREWGITDLSFLNQIKNIRRIDLSFQKIENIKPIENLHSLERLDLAYNKIKDITPLLRFLQPKVNSLKITVSDLNWFHIISLKGNPLIVPPFEVANQGNEAIVNFFDEIGKHHLDYLYEAKMLIVGQPRAGKTTFREKLFDISASLPADEETTRGIDIKRLSFDIKDINGLPRKFYYNIWDFGGQQIYHTTHQFFLTHRSLYVLVIDTSNDNLGNDDSIINYWLQATELLGDKSDLLLILNEKHGRRVNLNISAKKNRFKFIKQDYQLDLNALIEGTNTFDPYQFKMFKTLKQDLEWYLEKLPLVGIAMPKNWVDIRNKLQILSLTTPYITRQDYLEICEQSEVINFNKQMELSKIFHDLGIFLHFQNYAALEDFIILQNTWATDAVFAVLDNTYVQNNNGIFTEADLSKIWTDKKYKKEIHRKLLALMMQFELCYKVQKGPTSSFIIPQMLPQSPPLEYTWPGNQNLPLVYKYDFMPRGIITRLIVRLHKYIYSVNEQQMVWQTGVKIDGSVLGCENTFAELTESWDYKKLLIKVYGHDSKELMSKISYQIDELNDEYFNREKNNQNDSPRCLKMIPCNCSLCNKTEDKHFYEYDRLIFARKKIRDIQCPLSLENVNILSLLEAVFSKVEVNKAPRNIFISYSRADEKWKNELIKNLAALKNQELILEWHDKEIESGFWEPQIQEAMDSADIFLLIITQNFIASEYISSHEIIKAYNKFQTGDALIFPIICDSCDWKIQPISKSGKEFDPVLNTEIYPSLGKFQAFPKGGKPIKNWTNKQDGFLDVVNQLKKVLKFSS